MHFSAIRSSEDFQVKGMVNSPWRFLPQTTFEARHSNPSPTQTSVKIEQGEQELYFQQELTNNSDGWQLQYEIRTPWVSIHKISAVHKHKNTNHGWEHSMDMVRNNAKSAGTIRFNNPKSGDLELQASLSGDATFTLDASCQIDTTMMKMEGQGQIGFGEVKYTLTALGDIGLPQGKLVTKLQRMGQAHILDLNMAYNLAITDASGSATFNAMGTTYLNAALEADMTPLESKAQISVEIPGHAFHMATAHDLTGEQSTAQISGTYNGKSVNLQVKGSFEFFKADLNIQVQTPSQYWDLLEATITYNFEDAAKSIAFTTSRNGGKNLDILATLDLSGNIAGGKAGLTIEGIWHEPYVSSDCSNCFL